ncbi:MAG TPA: hypothetical protein VGM14_30240, partial [Streptosporangiaceae bacterium]
MAAPPKSPDLMPKPEAHNAVFRIKSPSLLDHLAQRPVIDIPLGSAVGDQPDGPLSGLSPRPIEVNVEDAEQGL